MKYCLLWLCCCLSFYTHLKAQLPYEKPKEDFASPYNSLVYYQYYMSPDHYQGQKFSRLFPKNTNNSSELALQLKQILDGRGLQIQLAELPTDSFFVDSLARKNIYVLFPNVYKDIYLELDKETQRWRFSSETVKAIPKLHKKVYPLGTDLLIQILPSFGDDKVLGLHVWQYLGIIIVAMFSYFLIWAISRLFRWIILLAAENKFGKDLFDKDIVLRISKVNSYLCVLYLLYILIPALQLPIELNYYVIVILRISTTALIVLLFSRSVDLVKAYYLNIKSKDENYRGLLSDNLVPIASRTVKVLIYLIGFFHVLSILSINVTALIAGLSIGGLAIALAAQETIKNLIGSAMIFADKPFKIGDYINNGSDIEGTVEDIGFRSTRIRNMDTSVVSVPNGKLIDMVVTNLGERQMRRFHTYINIAFATPTKSLKVYVDSLQQMVKLHPHTHKEELYVYVNRVEGYSLSIRFMIYFITDEWKEELKFRQDIILGITQLAEHLNIQIVPPATNVSFSNNAPNSVDDEELRLKAAHFLTQFSLEYPQPPPLDVDIEQNEAFSPS
jgi:MscS family membrane protein